MVVPLLRCFKLQNYESQVACLDGSVLDLRVPVRLPVGVSIRDLLLAGTTELRSQVSHLCLVQRNSGESHQSRSIVLFGKHLTRSDQLFQMLEISDEETRRDGIDEDGLFIERIAELMWQTNWDCDHISSLGVGVGFPWRVESNGTTLHIREIMSVKAEVSTLRAGRSSSLPLR